MGGESSFVPAKNKLEVVARISNLTDSGPETLGPGSKERKSVVVNLAAGLGIAFSAADSKQQIAAAIARGFGRQWNSRHESRGQTLTLDGLNLLLEIGSKVLTGSKRSVSWPTNVVAQAKLMTTVLQTVIPAKVDGKAAVMEMRSAGDSWKKTEWHGTYFEMKGIPPLVSQFGGGRQKINRTVFDYVNNAIWDFKAHTEFDAKGRVKTECPLNDSDSIDDAVKGGGFGLVVLCVQSDRTIAFARWHKKFRGQSGEPTRKLVEWFKPTSFDYYWIPNQERLKEAIERGEIKDFNQGKNSNGKPRPPKYTLVLSKARMGDLLIFQQKV